MANNFVEPLDSTTLEILRRWKIEVNEGMTELRICSSCGNHHYFTGVPILESCPNCSGTWAEFINEGRIEPLTVTFKYNHYNWFLDVFLGIL